MTFILKEKEQLKMISKNIAFPKTMVDRIESMIREETVSFSSFVRQACEYALVELESAGLEEVCCSEKDNPLPKA